MRSLTILLFLFTLAGCGGVNQGELSSDTPEAEAPEVTDVQEEAYLIRYKGVELKFCRTRHWPWFYVVRKDQPCLHHITGFDGHRHGGWSPGDDDTPTSPPDDDDTTTPPPDDDDTTTPPPDDDDVSTLDEMNELLTCEGSGGTQGCERRRFGQVRYVYEFRPVDNVFGVSLEPLPRRSPLLESGFDAATQGTSLRLKNNIVVSYTNHASVNAAGTVTGKELAAVYLHAHSDDTPALGEDPGEGAPLAALWAFSKVNAYVQHDLLLFQVECREPLEFEDLTDAAVAASDTSYERFYRLEVVIGDGLCEFRDADEVYQQAQEHSMIIATEHFLAYPIWAKPEE